MEVNMKFQFSIQELQDLYKDNNRNIKNLIFDVCKDLLAKGVSVEVSQLPIDPPMLMVSSSNEFFKIEDLLNSTQGI